MSETTTNVHVLEPPARQAPIACQRPAPSRLGRVARTIPNLLILLVLAGLAYAGHRTGWKLSKLSALTGAPSAGKDDWCAEHAVAETVCVECNPATWPRAKPPGWCRVHGVHECPWEHPEIAQLSYSPKVAPEARERARRALAFAPRAENASKCKLHLRRIQFASEEAVSRAGVDVVPVWESPVTESVRANGEVTYDPTRVARLSSRVRGTVWRVDKVVGQDVKKGDVLALVDAAEVGKAKGDFLQAVGDVFLHGKTLERLSSAADSVPEAKLRQAEADFQQAQVRLFGAEQALGNFGLPIRAEDVKGLSPEALRLRVRTLGLPPAVAKSVLDSKEAPSNLTPLLAPLAGKVVSREVVVGEVVDNAKVLFVVADTRRMMLTLHLRLEDARSVVPGQPVRFRPDGGPEAAGSVSWVSTAVDKRTRTVRARAELANAAGHLRDSSFGSGKVILRREEQAVVVPSEAVQWEGDCHVVFVRDKNYLEEGAPKVFHTRTVRPGARDGGNTEIIAGVLPGELVVAKGSAVLRSELLKNNLGEG